MYALMFLSIPDRHLDCFLLHVLFLFFNLFSLMNNPYNNLCGITVKHIFMAWCSLPQNLRHVASYPSNWGHRELHFTLSHLHWIAPVFIFWPKWWVKKSLFRVSVLDTFLSDYLTYLWEWIFFMYIGHSFFLFF